MRDNVGSVRAVINRTLNSNGQADVVTYNDYYPFGSVVRSGGATYLYDYQGAYAEKDPITGLNNFDLRMYNGKIGRWMSTDLTNNAGNKFELKNYEGTSNSYNLGAGPFSIGKVEMSQIGDLILLIL